MTPKLDLLLGTGDELTPLKIQLPLLQRRIAVLVSGGLDSAILYYILKSLVLQDSRYTLTPYTLIRADGSSRHAQLVIDYVNSVLGCNEEKTIPVPIKQTNSDSQVAEGIVEVLKEPVNIVYVGIITTLPKHALHGVSPPYDPVDTESVKYPLKKLTKLHVVDAIRKLNLDKLFELTHSCVYDIVGRCNECNRCNERAWAFEQLGLVDPGTN